MEAPRTKRMRAARELYYKQVTGVLQTGLGTLPENAFFANAGPMDWNYIFSCGGDLDIKGDREGRLGTTPP